MSAVIEAKDLSKWFGEVVALNNLTVTIEEGVTGFLGPNGAGKSTFMKLALGLYTPSRGYIRILGGAPRNNATVLRQIGYCPEIDHFYDGMTGYEFVYWLNRHWGMNARTAAKEAEAALDMVHMTARMHDPIDEYSKGMRQRTKIAQALALKPRLLFLDEPMTGLDPKGREEMFQLIRRLGDNGASVVFSSHILYEVERITDSVVLIYNGTILAHGKVAEIRDLLDEYPRTITVSTPEPRALAAHFSEARDILSLHFKQNALVLKTRDPNACYQRLNALALNGIELNGIQCDDDNLQSVFAYLTD
jgi:ABC-2 type transport system ATP-binding protein